VAALKGFAGDGERKSFDEVGADLSSEKNIVLIEMAASDGVKNDRARGHVVLLEEIASIEWFGGGLIEHVTAAARRDEENGDERQVTSDARCMMRDA
jgi:hypothetical protein